MNRKQSHGFSLVELLVGMVVGLIIISGAFSLHSATRKTQIKNEEQMDMVADARFAIEMIAYDLRHAGLWGATNNASSIYCKSSDTSCSASPGKEKVPSTITGDCEAGWYYNLGQPVFAVAGSVTNVYTNCIDSRKAGTDMLSVHYTESNLATSLVAGQVYVRSNNMNGRVFVGDKQPVLEMNEDSVLTQNHALQSHLYYVSSYTDSVGDGIPSLRRASLVNGPEVEDQMLISGVHDFQVAFGEDVTGDEKIDRYIGPEKITDWNNVYAAKVWAVMRSDRKQSIAATKSFTLDGVASSYGADGFRYFMVSSVVNFRN